MLQLHFIVTMASKGDTGYVIYSEVVGSSLAVLSLIKALQRRDDGCLTKALSFIGWIAFCGSRVFAFALLSSFVGAWVVIAILLHAAGATVFVFKIIKNAYQEQKDSIPEGTPLPRHLRRKNDSVLAVLSFFLFGLPSLMYWPMMFSFKKASYVYSFLVVSACENLLFFVLWFVFKDKSHDHSLGHAFAVAILVLTAVGVLFLCLYMCAKPGLTDKVVLSHIRETNSNKYGIFFDFCNAVHVLPNVQNIDHRREQIERLRPDLLPPARETH